MSIIFNEVEYAENIEKEKITSSYDIMRKGILLAKLYINRGLSDNEILILLNKKFDILDCSYNYNIKYTKIKKMLTLAKQNPNMMNKSIYFNDSELNFIHNINDINIEKILFIMLSITKFYNYAPIYFTNKEIFNLSKIKYTSKENDRIFNFLIKNKIYNIDERKVGNGKGIKKICYFLNDNIKCLDDINNCVIEIFNYKNLVYYYLNYFNIGSYLLCEDCKCIELRKSNSQVYCKECAKVRANKQRSDWKKKNK